MTAKRQPLPIEPVTNRKDPKKNKFGPIVPEKIIENSQISRISVEFHI